MVSKNANEIDEIVKGLKQNPGYKAYIVINNDGVVMRWDQEGEPMPYEKAVQYSHHVLDLYAKSKSQILALFDPQDNHIENIRIRTNDYELIAAQEGNFILIVLYDDEEKSKRKKIKETKDI